MTYFLAWFQKEPGTQGFYELVRAGNLAQAKSRAKKEHPDGYLIEVTEALT